MNNPGSGVDEAKYFSMTVALASHVPPSAHQRRGLAKALKGLIAAVVEQEQLRVVCRDLDVVAATRVRCWLYSA